MAQAQAQAQLVKIDDLSAFLTTRKKQIGEVMKDQAAANRALRIACAAVARNPKLQNCTVESLYLAIFQALQLRLEPGLGAHLVPYGNSVQMIIDYKGLVDLMHRHEKVQKVEAHVVRENDAFEWTLGLEPSLVHIPAKQNRGELKYVYAICRFKEGPPLFEVLDRETVMRHKAASRAKDSGPWVEWEEAMWRKTALRVLSNYAPRSIDARQALAIENAVEAGEQPFVGMEVEEIIKPADVTVQKTKTTRIKKQIQDTGKKTKQKTPDTSDDPTFRIEASTTDPGLLVFLKDRMGGTKNKKGAYEWKGLNELETRTLGEDLSFAVDPSNKERMAYQTGLLSWIIYNEATGKEVMNSKERPA